MSIENPEEPKGPDALSASREAVRIAIEAAEKIKGPNWDRSLIVGLLSAQLRPEEMYPPYGTKGMKT